MPRAKVPGVASPADMHQAAHAFIRMAGEAAWRERIGALEATIGAQRIAGRVAQDRHALELAIARLAERPPAVPTAAERAVATLAAEAVAVHAALSPTGVERLVASLRAALAGEATLVPLFHLLRTAVLNRARGFSVRFAGVR